MCAEGYIGFTVYKQVFRDQTVSALIVFVTNFHRRYLVVYRDATVLERKVLPTWTWKNNPIFLLRLVARLKRSKHSCTFTKGKEFLNGVRCTSPARACKAESKYRNPFRPPSSNLSASSPAMPPFPPNVTNQCHTPPNSRQLSQQVCCFTFFRISERSFRWLVKAGNSNGSSASKSSSVTI